MTTEPTTQPSESCFTYIDLEELTPITDAVPCVQEFNIPMPLMLLAACFGVG